MSAIRTFGRWLFRVVVLVVLVCCVSWLSIHASRAYYSRLAQQSPSAFIVHNEPVIALEHARVIDGTGAPALEDQTIIVANGVIASVGPSSAIGAPQGAAILDLTGKTVYPGLVMMHEHLFTIDPDSFPKLRTAVEMGTTGPLMYLAAGVTTMRTAGTMFLEGDEAAKRAVDSSQRVGPDIILTAPYLESAPTAFAQMHTLATPDEGRAAVDAGVARGITWFKGYVGIKPDILKAAIEEAHAKGARVTGHLCSVGFTEAADMGIDGLEHGINVDTEFLPSKQPGVCPPQGEAIKYFSETLDIDGAPVQAMMHHLIDKRVVIDSTLAVFEDFGGAPKPMESMEGRELRAMSFKTWLEYATLRAFFLKRIANFPNLSTKEYKFEREFVAAGGMMVGGADPTGDEGTLPGYADQRELELLVAAGFTPAEAIHICTANGAQVLGRGDRIGTIAQGKQADLVVVKGDPSRNISDVRNVELVFRNGTAYDSPKMLNAVKGLVGVE